RLVDALLHVRAVCGRGLGETFEDVLERFPKATPAYRSYVKKRVDEARRLLAQADGWLSPLARSVQLGVFNTIAREMPGGRLRVLYPGAKYDQQNDWSVSHGYVHTSGEYNFCMHRVSHPLNAFHWLYRHGENVRLSFRAKAHCPHGCVLFGVPGAADGAGLVLSVGADRKSATTLGIAGQPPLYRDKVGAHGSWTTYTLAVTDGQLTFHRADKLLFTGRIDVGGLRGRDVIFWGKPLPSDKDRSPKFDDIKIDSLPQHDWVACHRRGTLPVRPTDRPDPSGWLGLSTTLRHPQFPRYAIWSRTRWGASSGNTTVLSVSTYGQPHLALSTLSGIRDCIITARVEFPERVVPDRSCSFGIVCRATGDGAYVGAVSPHGDAAISARKYRRSAGLDPIARGTLPVEPGRFLNVVAIVQGSRLELYCNGHRAVSTDQLPDTTGRVGVELTDGAAILHDVKYRLLPSDPGYDALYRKARP
ncbi:hypothetical protein HQ560_10090, partial [bacterium]|nr:hypothetical protein [bacterium]